MHADISFQVVVPEPHSSTGGLGSGEPVDPFFGSYGLSLLVAADWVLGTSFRPRRALLLGTSLGTAVSPPVAELPSSSDPGEGHSPQ